MMYRQRDVRVVNGFADSMIRDITNYRISYAESGAVSAEYEYDPFGKVIAHTGRDFDFLFSTKFYDPDIGMYYYGYRYYSPELRRWASPDPIGEAGGLNLYGFCGNDGVNVYDSVGYKGVRLVSLEYPEAIDNEFLGPESDVELDNLDSIKQVAVVTPEITGGGTDIRGVKIITDSFGYICELRIMIRIVYHFPTGSGNNDSGTVFYYYAHKLGNDKLGVANIMITDQIIEHERGHAKAFLQFYPKLKRDLETYIGKFSLWRKTAIRELFKSNIHYRTYKLFSARYANEATVHYLDTHGWIRIPNFTPNSKFGLSHGETDYAWRKK